MSDMNPVLIVGGMWRACAATRARGYEYVYFTLNGEEHEINKQASKQASYPSSF
ncbi:MAG: hypothetical protein IH600_08405 [Bacteroidetes bacterium]|nr:hypothetical protein [Bacteroidota bacterium]